MVPLLVIDELTAWRKTAVPTLFNVTPLLIVTTQFAFGTVTAIAEELFEDSV